MQPGGQLIDGKYQLVEIAGEGGMATVYKAVQKGAAGFQRTVAIKHIKPEYRALKNYVDMFIEEARVGSELAHPNIVQVHDFIIQDGAYYLVTEWVEGEARPALHGYQAAGAAPLVHGKPVENPETVASAIRIGNSL